jgi:hypothetical protein
MAFGHNKLIELIKAFVYNKLIKLITAFGHNKLIKLIMAFGHNYIINQAQLIVAMQKITNISYLSKRLPNIL